MAVLAFLRNVMSQFEFLKIKIPEYSDLNDLSNRSNNVANLFRPSIFQVSCSFLVNENSNKKLRFRTIWSLPEQSGQCPY